MKHLQSSKNKWKGVKLNFSGLSEEKNVLVCNCFINLNDLNVQVELIIFPCMILLEFKIGLKHLKKPKPFKSQVNIY